MLISVCYCQHLVVCLYMISPHCGRYTWALAHDWETGICQWLWGLQFRGWGQRNSVPCTSAAPTSSSSQQARGAWDPRNRQHKPRYFGNAVMHGSALRSPIVNNGWWWRHWNGNAGWSCTRLQVGWSDSHYGGTYLQIFCAGYASFWANNIISCRFPEHMESWFVACGVQPAESASYLRPSSSVFWSLVTETFKMSTII